ncbi:MAG: hypothetical protein IKA47_06495, partial [Oscillospiraceae bacterium]|nr:hypothetical protein [Oscillospiraceae bacterium]
MEKFIPYEKLSKKEKRKMDLAKRQTWGELNPVTRSPENSKAYNRNKARNWKREYHEASSSGTFFMLFPPGAKAPHRFPPDPPGRAGHTTQDYNCHLGGIPGSP